MKKKQPKCQPYPEVPPYAFWISSHGEIGWGTTHLSVLRDKPKMFGLIAVPDEREAILSAYDTAYAHGWGRVNVNGALMLVTMERPLKALFDELSLAAQKWPQIRELYVEFIDGTDPWGPYPIGTLIDERFPAQWQINPGKGSR